MQAKATTRTWSDIAGLRCDFLVCFALCTKSQKNTESAEPRVLAKAERCASVWLAACMWCHAAGNARLSLRDQHKIQRKANRVIAAGTGFCVCNGGTLTGDDGQRTYTQKCAQRMKLLSLFLFVISTAHTIVTEKHSPFRVPLHDHNRHRYECNGIVIVAAALQRRWLVRWWYCCFCVCIFVNGSSVREWARARERRAHTHIFSRHFYFYRISSRQENSSKIIIFSGHKLQSRLTRAYVSAHELWARVLRNRRNAFAPYVTWIEHGHGTHTAQNGQFRFRWQTEQRFYRTSHSVAFIDNNRNPVYSLFAFAQAHCHCQLPCDIIGVKLYKLRNRISTKRKFSAISTHCCCSARHCGENKELQAIQSVAENSYMNRIDATLKR